MKIIVFGATGNVGRQVVAEALRRHRDVVGVVRDPQSVESPDPRIRLVKGDATDAESVRGRRARRAREAAARRTTVRGGVRRSTRNMAACRFGLTETSAARVTTLSHHRRP